MQQVEVAGDKRFFLRSTPALDRMLGFEHHTIRGEAKMEMRVTLALVVMLAMALGRIQIGQVDKMRSRVAQIDRAARERLFAKPRSTSKQHSTWVRNPLTPWSSENTLGAYMGN